MLFMIDIENFATDRFHSFISHFMKLYHDSIFQFIKNLGFMGFELGILDYNKLH